MPKALSALEKEKRKTNALKHKVIKGITRKHGSHDEETLRPLYSAVTAQLEYRGLVAHLIKTGVIDPVEYEKTQQQVLEVWIRETEQELSKVARSIVVL